MATKAERDRKDAKRAAVVARWNEINVMGIETLSGIWDERQLDAMILALDAMILALGIGHVEIDNTGA